MHWDGRTFGLVMCARYFQQTEDAGHPSQAGVGVRVFKTGDGALQDVQHALVHFPVHFLQTQRSNKVVRGLASNKTKQQIDFFFPHTNALAMKTQILNDVALHFTSNLSISPANLNRIVKAKKKKKKSQVFVRLPLCVSVSVFN